MKYLFLAFAFLPAIAFAQQASNLSDEQIAAIVAKASDFRSGNFPASCEAPMAKYQLSQALQAYAGDPAGDDLTGLIVMRQVGAATDKSYSCMVMARWRDHGVQQGMVTLVKAGNGVLVQWHPFSS